MTIDAFTVLLFGLLVKLVLGGLFLFFWWRSRRAPWFAWWGVCLLLGAVSSFFFVYGFEGTLPALVVAAGFLTAAMGCCWQGARAFQSRPIRWAPIIAAPALWLAACLMPGFLENVTFRIVLSSCLLGGLAGLTAYEFWRGRQERLPSRWPIIALFASLAAIFMIRIPLLGLAPYPVGALPVQPSWIAGFNIVMFFHTVTLAVLLVSLTTERLELQQRNRAQTDPLTGALNRRAFMIRGRRLILRHQRGALPLCLLFLDLDHFKMLNDRFGHSGGDDVLMRFVAIVHNNIRPDDFLFRMGGEEFCCLLPQTQTEQAFQVAERIRRRWEEETIEIAGVPVKVTVSIGIAPAATFGYDADTLVRKADAAVYVAKRQGRNSVVIAKQDAMADDRRAAEPG